MVSIAPTISPSQQAQDEAFAQQLGERIEGLERRYAKHMARLRVRRMLIELVDDADTGTTAGRASKNRGNRTGTNIPEPFHESGLLIKTMIGDAAEAAANYANRISTNPPVVDVDAIVAARPSKPVLKNSGEQERWLMSTWHDAGGDVAQRKSAWSQAWGRVGWYLTLPREVGWGLPDRNYFEDLTDTQLEGLARKGTVVPVNDGGKIRFGEPAETWFKRRSDAARGNAISGKTLFTLTEYPPDMVWAEYDREGEVAWGAIIEEVDSGDFRVGSEKSAEIARALGTDEADIGKFGVWAVGDKIVSGVREGHEPQVVSGQTWRLITYIDREEVVYMVAATRASKGVVFYREKHGANGCPLVPVPAMITDSRGPGSNYHSPMESVFTLTPIINQIETLLSNVAAYNAIPRWVVEDASGNLQRDPDTNQPRLIMQDPTVGLNPKDAEVVNGKVKQLEIKADVIVKLLEFYLKQLELAKPAPVTEGQAGTSGPAWTVRQLKEAAGEQLQQPVDNHAKAVAKVFGFWVHWAQALDTPIFSVATPQQNAAKGRRGLIEIKPADLISTFVVRQDKTSASERIVLDQAGQEKLALGLISDEHYWREFALAQDPQEMMIQSYVQQAKRFVLVGDTSVVEPGSMIWRVAKSAEGQAALEMVKVSENFAIAQAEAMVAGAQTNAPGVPPDPVGNVQGPAGNVAESMGLRQAGTGAAGSLPGSPAGREDEVRPL